MALRRVVLAVIAGSLIVALVPACARTANVLDLYTALDADGNRKRNVFYTDTQEIHCVGEIAASRPDATFRLQIRTLQFYDYEKRVFVDTNRVGSTVEYAPGGNGGGKQKVDALIQKLSLNGDVTTDGPYGAGRAQCEMYLDGDSAMTAVYNVLIPPCPDGEIIQSKACFGFFDKGAVCPQFGLTSTDPATCTCDQALGWQCTVKQ